MPLVSTIVVIAGLAATAGSPLNHLIKKGNEVPTNVAVITYNPEDNAIINAILYKL